MVESGEAMLKVMAMCQEDAMMKNKEVKHSYLNSVTCVWCECISENRGGKIDNYHH